MPKGEIFGNIKDSLTEKAVAYATVIALRQPGDRMVGGVVTTDNGSFSIPDVPYGEYKLKISFVGYDTKFIESVELNDENKTYQLKNLILTPPFNDSKKKEAS